MNILIEERMSPFRVDDLPQIKEISLMATNAFVAAKDPAFTNVSFETFRNTKKDKKNYLAQLYIDDVCLPLMFEGTSPEEARQSAASFFKSNVFNHVFDFSHINDVDLTHKSVLSLFATKPSIASKKARKADNGGGEDRRHAFKDLKWYVRQDEAPVRIAKADIQKYLDDGYIPGKKWKVALAKHQGTYGKSGKKNVPGYVNPIAGKILMHKAGEENIRVEENQVADLIQQGWTRGRPPKTVQVAAPAPEKAPEAGSETDKEGSQP